MSAEEVFAFERALPPERRPREPKDLARELIHAGRLTKYQVTAVYQGKTKGLVLGDYVIQEEIGAGGMGQVFKAWHRTMERAVALKVLPPQAVRSKEAIERFHREVRAVARLTHPNIVTAYHAGEDQGTHYLVMEYVGGRDLARLLAERGPLPIPDAVGYVIQAARGLEYAHKLGIVHRDIKPANLLLDLQGTVKILDLGLARIQTADPYAPTAADRLTESGYVFGTYDYMSPEQAQDTHTADHRADIYSLGCTLFRLVTGQKPYQGETPVQIMLAHCQAPIPSLRELRQDVSPELDAVCRKMLAKDPAERQQSMAEVAEDLERCIRAVSSPAPERFPATGQPSGESSSPSDSALKAFLRNVSKPATATRTRQAGGDAETACLEREEQTGTLRAGRPPARASKNKTAMMAGGVIAGLALIAVLGFTLLGRGPKTQEPKAASADKPQGAPAADSSAAVGEPESYLVLRWPEAERTEAMLEIDGRPRELSGPGVQSSAEEVRLAVPAGPHKVWIARRGYEPIEERYMAVFGELHTLDLTWQAAPTAADEPPPEPEPSDVAASPPPAEPQPEPKALETPPPDPTIVARLEAEERYAEALRPINALIVAWDFQAASVELEKLTFPEADLAARLAAWQRSVERLNDLKARMIARINTADPRLKKTELLIRGTGGDLTGADEKGITAELVGGKTEMLAWTDVGPQAVERLVGLVSIPGDAEDRLAAGVLALASDAPNTAEKSFEQARSQGADTGPYLAPLAAAMFAEARNLLDEGSFEEADSLLANIEAKYAAILWFTANKPAFGAAGAQAKAGIYEAEAEKLYQEAADLFAQEELFDVKALVEKLKTDYPRSRVMTDATRKPSFGELEQSAANLGPVITVRQDGKGDFTSIQAAIDAAQPSSLIEIQDDGPYRERILIQKHGLTISGKRGCWPIVTSSDAGNNSLPARYANNLEVDVLLNSRGSQTAVERVILLHTAPSLPDAYCIAVNARTLRLRRALVYIHSGDGIWCEFYENRLTVEDSIVLTNVRSHQRSYFKNSLLVGHVFGHASLDLRSCTVTGGVQFGPYGTNIAEDCILRSIATVGAVYDIQHCDLMRSKADVNGRVPESESTKGCIAVDPQFRDPANLDYRLQPTSPCIGKASDGGDIGCRYTPEMIELCEKALELRRQGILKF